MNIEDYFDVNNKQHLEAYRNGSWPWAVLDNETIDAAHFSHMWQVLVAAKLANAWVAEKL